MGMADDIGAMRWHDERGTLRDFQRGDAADYATADDVQRHHPIDRITDLLRRPTK